MPTRSLGVETTPLHSAAATGLGRLNLGHPAVLVLAGLLLSTTVNSAPAKAQAEGFIHGTVTTSKGQTFSGLLRWDDEEAFWGDLFNSRKTATPYLNDRGDGGGSKREYEVFGRKISFDWGGSSVTREFIARFGDIRSIEVLDDDEARLTMKDDSTLTVSGASNDVNATIKVFDPTLGEVEVPWGRIDTVVFSAAPVGMETYATRLHGKVETKNGTFSGFVQWDKQEGLSVDRLDGDDGDIELSLIMGNLREIKRDGKDASIVVLKDGREITLDDSNDVDDDNRGLLVEDKRYGKVEVPWMSFTKVTFTEPDALDPRNGPSYDSYQPKGALLGTVSTNDGQMLTGRVVFDLDEERDWELFSGKDDKLTYFVPFGLIETLEPVNGNQTRLRLRTGSTLMLGGTGDAAEDNAGVLVINGETETFVTWHDLRLLRLQ